MSTDDKKNLGGRHSHATQTDAMMRYAAGEMPERIATSMGIDPGTISRWRSRKIPGDWEEARRQFDADVARKALAELTEKRKGLAKDHFNTLDYMHRHIKRLLLKQKAGAPPGTMVLNEDLSPNDVQRIARAFSLIQTGQRLIFGQETYIAGTGASTATEAVTDIDPAAISEIERALAEVTANPGEAIDGGGGDD